MVEHTTDVCMPWEVEYKPEQKMVVVIATGQVSDRDGKDQAEEAIRLLRENRATLVLVVRR
jgi:hypothetical protein